MPNPHEMYDAAVALKNEGDLAGAVAKLREVLTVDPNHTDTHCALAVYLQKAGESDAAIQHALKVVELQPNDPFSYTQLSTVCMRCGQIPQAEAALARAREIQGGACH
ncbi:MAG: tetratricopeptide repeat protein [Planctomycetaceae bacterium]|nr:tetratricopeptide repeat protein [Planctomycetaceae bacterium]